MKIISVYSIKGGVGKTATTVNLAYLASTEGYRTLICDLDPQGASSYYFRIKASKGFSSYKFIRGGKHIQNNIKGTDFDNLDLLPSKLSYRNLDLALDAEKKSKSKLKKILKELTHDYDYIFLDCPPSISLISENIFNASDYIFVPLIPTTLSVRTYVKLLKFFKKENLDRSKLFAFFSMVEKRKKMHNEIIETMINNNKYFLKTTIPYRSEIENMGLYRQPIASYLKNSDGTRAYTNLWNEIKQIIS
ncbi:MAG: AAA family ATPase [Candidatus Dadabacteria bacterium]|nr:AAA family ATPase [Candidatus Dadabacteria bacterium]NIQ15668.1 AAA family ATPase [Candidatus Dadabacteria bacterium]